MKVLVHENVNHFDEKQMLRDYDYEVMKNYEIDSKIERIMNRSNKRLFPEKKNIV